MDFQRKVALAVLAFIVGLLGCAAKPKIEVREASRDAVSGWSQMQPRGDEPTTVWVAPEPVLASDAIADAEHARDNVGRLAILLELTDSGAANMEALSTRSIGKPVAVFLDGELVSAPIVQSQLSRRIMIVGFTEEEANRVVAAYARR